MAGVGEIVAASPDEAYGSSSKSDNSANEKSAKADISKCVKRAHMVLRKSALAENEKILEREILREVVEETSRRWAGCLMLPVTICFFAFYAASVTIREGVTYGHLMEAPIRDTLVGADHPHHSEDLDNSQLAGVLTIPDVWDFLRKSYIPLFFKQHDALNRSLPREEWSTISSYSQVVGVITMRQQRSFKTPCKKAGFSGSSTKFTSHLSCYYHPLQSLPFMSSSVKPTTEPFDNISLEELEQRHPLPENQSFDYGMTKCHASTDQTCKWSYFKDDDPNALNILNCKNEGFSTERCSNDRRLAGYVRDEMLNVMPYITSKEEDNFLMALDTNTSIDVIRARMKYLKDRGWLDKQTSNLKLISIILNRHLEIPRLSMIHTTFYFSRGGGVFSNLKMETFSMKVWINQWGILFDLLFVILLAATTLWVVMDLMKAVRSRQIRHHFSATNFLNWASSFVAWVNIGGIVFQEILRRRTNDSLIKWMETRTEKDALALEEDVSQMKMVTMWIRVMAADALILFMCRCFVSLQWQPRLGVVTATLTATSVDLIHFLIVLIPTVLGFCLAGMIMFGRWLEEFSSLISSVGICFKIAIESEYKWMRLSENMYWTALTWTMLYLILVVLLMLNMILAIIMDVYAEVRQHAGESMTLWAHLWYLYHRVYYRKQWVLDAQLLEQVAEMPQTIVVSELRQAFPEMHDYQLNYLVTTCQNKSEVILRVGINQSYTAQMVAAMHLSLNDVLQDLNAMKARGWMGKGMEVGNDPDREQVRDILTSIAVQSHWMKLAQRHIVSLQKKIQGEKKHTKVHTE